MKSETHAGALDPIAEVYAERDRLRTQLKSVEARLNEIADERDDAISQRDRYASLVSVAAWLVENAVPKSTNNYDLQVWLAKRHAFLNPKPQDVK